MKHGKWVLGALVMIGLGACQKDPADNLKNDESLVYITNRDSSANFSSYSTFAISDSVAVISNNQLESREQTPYDAQLINAVVRNLTERGFTRAAVRSNADLVVSVSRLYNNYNQLINYGDYWNSYDAYWDPYYWGYPGYSYYYPSYYGIYTITDGAVEIDMFDLKNAAANSNQLKYVWNGMIRGSGTFNQSRIDNSVNALFSQSPYLRKQL